MALLSDLETSIRAATQHDSDSQVTQPQIYAWVNEEYQMLRRRLADLVPDLYTAISADIVVTSPASSFGVVGSGLALTDFGKLRIVERKEGGYYFPIPLAPFLNADITGTVSYRPRGTGAAVTIDLFPAVLASATYRVKYVTKPAVLAAAGSTVDLPDGGERVIIERVAARVRVRLDDDPTAHERWAAQAWDELRSSIVRQDISTPCSIIDVTGRY
jgi:hypothetical protein